MALDSETPASKSELKALASAVERLEEKLDVILFAQAETIMRLRKKDRESAQLPMYMLESMRVAVGMKEADLREVFDKMSAELKRLQQQWE